MGSRPSVTDHRHRPIVDLVRQIHAEVLTCLPIIGLDHGASAGHQGSRVVDGALDVGYAQLRAGRQFEVLDQTQPAAAGVEDGGAVVVGGSVALAVLEPGLPGVGDDLVGEARGQRENAVRVVDERREGALTGRGPPMPVRLGFRQRGDRSGYDETDAGGTAGEDAATRKGHEGSCVEATGCAQTRGTWPITTGSTVKGSKRSSELFMTCAPKRTLHSGWSSSSTCRTLGRRTRRRGWSARQCPSATAAPPWRSGVPTDAFTQPVGERP